MSGVTTFVDGVKNLGVAKAESLQLGASAEGILSVQKIEEEVTIAVASGNTPPVTTTGNLAPANSIIKTGSFVVTQAPGGGAATIDIGVTGGDLDLFIDGMSCDVLGESGRFFIDGEAVAVAANTGVPLVNKTATTLTLTTDADVTTSDMKVLVTVWYETVTPPA